MGMFVPHTASIKTPVHLRDLPTFPRNTCYHPSTCANSRLLLRQATPLLGPVHAVFLGEDPLSVFAGSG